MPDPNSAFRLQHFTSAGWFSPENLEAYDQQQALDLRMEKEAFDFVAKKLGHFYFTSIIKLNVGGQHFTISLQKLAKDSVSMLHVMFLLKKDLSSLIEMEHTSGIC